MPNTVCQECGMPTEPGEYHPYAACLMFKACHNSATVRASLAAVRSDGMSRQAERVRLAYAQGHAAGMARAADVLEEMDLSSAADAIRAEIKEKG